MGAIRGKPGNSSTCGDWWINPGLANLSDTQPNLRLSGFNTSGFSFARLSGHVFFAPFPKGLHSGHLGPTGVIIQTWSGIALPWVRCLATSQHLGWPECHTSTTRLPCLWLHFPWLCTILPIQLVGCLAMFATGGDLPGKCDLQGESNLTSILLVCWLTPLTGSA